MFMEFISMEDLKKLLLLFLILIILCIVLFVKYQIDNNSTKSEAKTGYENKENNIKVSDFANSPDIINIKVNAPTELSYTTKEYVYNLRKKYLNQSIFEDKNYTPSEEVFGFIEDNKPWVVLGCCLNKEKGIIDVHGPSEESRFINNPSMLVAIDFPFPVNTTDKKESCLNLTIAMVPTEITYQKSTKEITVTYEKFPYSTTGTQLFYTFNGLNANDLGYKYAYVDKNKSTYIPKFTEEDNISSRVIEFQDFLHTGGSCGVAGGCTNGSPRQPYLEFSVPSKGYNIPAYVYIKLWKNQPASPYDTPDIVEKIVIKNS